MIRQVAKVVCNGEYKVVVDTDKFNTDKLPYTIYKCEYGHRRAIRKCYSLHEALGRLANMLIEY